MKYLIWFILICIALFFIRKFMNKFKLCKIGSLSLVTGGVKCGKSTLSTYMAISTYKQVKIKVKIKNFFRKLFKKELIEEPLLYSNIPLACDYVQVTEDLLLRNKRFRYGSVILIQEASLLADSQLIRDMTINERLLLFNKLIGHETKGGCIIYDTQSISDCHYSIKRCLSNYFYIHHLVKWVPFFLIAYVQEFRYSDDNSTISISEKDTEDTLKKVIIPKSTWKYFDCYNYSTFTDNLPIEEKVVNNDKKSNLKSRTIVSFRKNYNKECDIDEKKKC